MLTLFNDNVFLVQSMIILIQILCRQIFQIDFTDWLGLHSATFIIRLSCNES